MTTTLEFARHNVQRVIEHMTTATEWWGGYDDDDEHDPGPNSYLSRTRAST
jgi:hypothetical protein